MTDPDGGITRYEYDSSHRLTRITDARNIVYLQNFYGSSGRVLRQVVPSACTAMGLVMLREWISLNHPPQSLIVI